MYFKSRNRYSKPEFFLKALLTIVTMLFTTQFATANTIIESEDFESGTFGDWTTYSVKSDEDWEIRSYSGNYYAYANGFGADEASDDWLISPQLDLSDYSWVKLDFLTARNYGGPDLQVKISDNYSGGSPTSATWTDLSATLSSGGWTWTSSGDISLNDFIGSNVHIAFRYISTSPNGGDGAGYEVDDIEVTGFKPIIIESEDFEDGTLGNWTAYSVKSNRDWHNYTYSGEKFARMSGYNADEGSDDWLISPELDFTYYSELYLMFRNAQNYSGKDMTVKISRDYEDGNPYQATWETLDYNKSSGGFVWVNSGNVNISDYSGYSSVYIAFHYLSDSPSSSDTKTWEVDDIIVKEDNIPKAQKYTLFAESFEHETFGCMQTFSKSSNKDWEVRSFSGRYYAYANGYGGDEGSNDWLITPLLDLRVFKNVQMTFWTAKNYSGPDIQVKVSTDYPGKGDPAMYTWENLDAELSGGGWDWTGSGIISFDQFIGKKIYVAWHYSSNGGAAAWEVDDIEITGERTRHSIVDEGFNGSFGDWTTVSLSSNLDWITASFGGKEYAYMNGYQADEASNDWLISPVLDFRGFNDLVLNFETAAKWGGPSLKILISTDYDGGSDPTTATWTELSAILSPDNYVWTPSGDIDLDAWKNSGNVYIAFQYISTSPNSGDGRIWEVDNVVVTADMSTIFPEAFALSQGDYIFRCWSAESEAGTYPAHIEYRMDGDSSPESDEEFEEAWPLSYNLTSRSRINGLYEGGVLFQNTSSTNSGAEYAGAAVVALNTLGRDEIKIDWLAGVESMNSSGRLWRIRIQYRVGNSGDFIDILDKNSQPVEFKFDYSMSEGKEEHFTTMLPVATENQAYVEVRWIYYEYDSNGGGARPGLRLDDICITSKEIGGYPVKLAITQIFPPQPLVNLPMTFTVDAVNKSGSPKPVENDTDVELLLIDGNGNLTGQLTGLIPAGQSRLILPDIFYDIVEDDVTVQAVTTSDELENSDPEMFDVFEGATYASFFDVYYKIHVGEFQGRKIYIPDFEVIAYKDNDEIDPNYVYPVELELVNGPGNFLGTKMIYAEKGIAEFEDLCFDQPGTYVIKAKCPGLPEINSDEFEANAAPTITEIIVPKNMKSSAGAGDGGRLPHYALIELNNLHQNTEYRFITGARNSDYIYFNPGQFGPADDEGAGNNFHYDYASNSYFYNSSTDIDDDNEFSTFHTGYGDFSKRVWINIVNTGNTTFNEGNEVEWIFILGNEEGDLISRNRLINTSIAVDFGSNQNDATGIYDIDSWITPMNFVVLYDDREGYSMPFSTAIVQEDGAGFFSYKSDGTPWPSQGPVYYADLDEATGSWATLIPNSVYYSDEEPTEPQEGYEPIALIRLEQYTHDGQLVHIWQDNDGIWAGVNTNNPSGGSYYPINFETPQLRINYPSQDYNNDICNDMTLDYSWESHGIANLKILISEDGGASWETLQDNINARNGEYSWNIPYQVFSENENIFRILTEEYDYYLNEDGLFSDITSTSGNLTIWDAPQLVDNTVSSINCAGSDIELLVVANGSQLKYEWTKDGENLPQFNGPILNIDNVDYQNSGVYQCTIFGNEVCSPVITERIPVYVVSKPDIVREPSDAQIVEGGKVMFELEAHATGAPADYEITVQWYRGATPLVDNDKISGSRSSVLTVSNVDASDEGSDYYAVVTEMCGTAQTRNVSITLTTIEIVSQPADLRECVGNAARLNVEAQTTNGGNLEYQWFKDGEALYDDGRITGTNSPELVLNVLNSDDKGVYYCQVTQMPENRVLMTEEAEVLVSTVPVIVINTDSQLTVEEGKELNLSVETAKSGNSYQWYKNGQPISGATYSEYAVDAVRMDDNGYYHCEITNDCGMVQSIVTAVTVDDGTFPTDVRTEPVTGGYYIGDFRPMPVTGNEATLFFMVPVDTRVQIVLGDIAGNEVAILYEGYAYSGDNEVTIDFSNLNIASGVYTYSLISGTVKITNKLVFNL